MSLTNQEISQRLFDGTIRIESILFLGGMEEMECSSDAVEEFLQGFDEHTIKTLSIGLPWLSDLNWEEAREECCAEDDEEDGKTFVFTARDRGCFGLLVQAAHPVMEFFSDCSGASFSWGYYSTGWFYGETMAEVLPAIEAWAEALDAEQKAKVAAPQIEGGQA